nr:hypothetical protein CFP56_20270 [Quercus suber]
MYARRCRPLLRVWELLDEDGFKGGTEENEAVFKGHSTATLPFFHRFATDALENIVRRVKVSNPSTVHHVILEHRHAVLYILRRLRSDPRPEARCLRPPSMGRTVCMTDMIRQDVLCGLDEAWLCACLLTSAAG